MQTRRLGPFTVSQIAMGCMGLSSGYGGRPDRETAQKILHQALDLGCTLIDTAPMYGRGANETLIGETLKARRGEYVLASKCGLWSTDDGKRIIDSRPQTVLATLEDSLRRLQTDVIDLYYVHRPDPHTPIEETVGALAGAVKAGKIKAIGLSEMSAETLRRAHAVHPIAAMQSEYSLWTRNPEIAGLQACRELGAAFVAFSPLARGFLTAEPPDPPRLEPGDLRGPMPRFIGEAYAANLKLLGPFGALAREAGCSPAQLALAWVLAQGEEVIAIPGTGKLNHLADNVGADKVTLSPEMLDRLDRIINQTTVRGPRYTPSAQADVTTEEFAP